MLAKDEPELRKVMMTLEEMSMDSRMRELARVRERGLRDYITDTTMKYERGRVEGREEGRVEGREEGLQLGEHVKAVKISTQLISEGKDDEYISQLTGLEIADIVTLRANNL